MSTHAMIAQRVSGRYKAVYCHWDGYPSGVGATLRESYADVAKVSLLISMGDVATLEEGIGEKHAWDDRGKGWTTFAHRDLGLEWEFIQPLTFRSTRELLKHAYVNTTRHVYIYRDGRWSYSHEWRRFRELTAQWVLERVGR